MSQLFRGDIKLRILKGRDKREKKIPEEEEEDGRNGGKLSQPWSRLGEGGGGGEGGRRNIALPPPPPQPPPLPPPPPVRLIHHNVPLSSQRGTTRSDDNSFTNQSTGPTGNGFTPNNDGEGKKKNSPSGTPPICPSPSILPLANHSSICLPHSSSPFPLPSLLFLYHSILPFL